MYRKNGTKLLNSQEISIIYFLVYWLYSKSSSN